MLGDMGRKPQRPLDVLLVEDSVADAELVREALDDLDVDAHLEVVGDADGALARLDDPAARPHLVLLDLRLPGRSGFDVLEHVKTDASLRLIPVLILSSSGAPGDVRRAYASHANTYLRKPSGFDELVDLMETVAGYWRGKAELAISD